MTRILLKDLPKVVDLLINAGYGNKEVNLNALTDTLEPSKHNTRTKKRNNKPKTKESLKDDEALQKLVDKNPLAIYSTNTDVRRLGEVTKIHFWNPDGDTFCKMFSPNGPGKPKNWKPIENDEALQKLVDKNPLAIYSTNTDVRRLGEVTKIHFWNPDGDTFCKMFSPNGPGKPKNWKPIENKEQLQDVKSNQDKKICEKCTENMKRDLTKKQLNNYDLN